MTDIPGDSSTTAHVSVGGSLIGSIETGGDHDWIAVQLVAGQKYEITLDGYGANALVDPFLILRNASGLKLAENDDGDGNRNSRIVFTAKTSGTYYIDAAAWDDAAGTYQYTGDYKLSVSIYTPPPVYDYDQIADQLVNGFWGGDWHHWNVTQGDTINVNLRAQDDVVLRRVLGRDLDHPLAVELPGHRAGSTEAGAVLREDRAHVGGGAVAVVGQSLDDHGHAARAVALVDHLLEAVGIGVRARAAGDRPVDRLKI